MKIETARLKRSRLQEILASFGGLKIAVIGDYGLDAYWCADMTRAELSRETPRHMRPVIAEEYSAGASGNICCNLRAMGVGTVLASTVFGDDWRGRILKEKLEQARVRLDHSITAKERFTTAFIKPILYGWDSRQEDSRLDFVNGEPLAEDVEKSFVKAARAAVEEADAVIVEDQVVWNGAITGAVRKALNRLARMNAGKVFVADSRERIGLFRGMVLKPNRVEAVKAALPWLNPADAGMEELAAAGRALQEKCGKPVFITMGEDGSLVVAEKSCFCVPAVPLEPPFDPVGAGDAFIAALAASLASGVCPAEAAGVASLAAGVVVKKIGTTGTATAGEILEKFGGGK